MPTLFDWKRYWCPRDKSVSLSDGGFLPDPDTKWGRFANPDLIQFEQVVQTPCLALLGEPGVGKSLALDREILDIEKSILSAGGSLIRLDLRSFGSEDRLMNSLFESEEFERWRGGDYGLHLFLDSLDECLLRIDNVATLLCDELPKQPRERLHLRIVCRTAPWPMILEKSLIRLFGLDGFGAYELMPLRRVDVKLAANQSGIADTDSFLDRIDDLALASLAIKPVTLNFLINTYLKEKAFPRDQIDLYEKGCRILCGEPSESRQGSGKVGHLSAEQRLAVASRIAGVTQLANRYAVWTGSEADRLPEEDVLIGELAGDHEYGPNLFTISEESIRETLDTGLFSSRGPHRIGWAHQTYAEYLAARYCKEREMPISQIQNLIIHPASFSAHRLVPQMHEIAAWMSVMNPEVFRLVANTDPEALLGSAAASLTDEQRYILVESILNHSGAGRSFHLRWGMFWLYGKLKHPQLAGQLRKYLADTSKGVATRHVAVDIGRACNTEELGPDLAVLAMNTSENISIRKSAAAAAADVGSAEVRNLLRPLAFEQAGPDPDDELKGAGLKALWPNLITLAEMIPLITNPKNPNLRGLYTSFLYDFPSKISESDLPVALEWFCEQPSRHNVSFPIGHVLDKIALLAWAKLDHPGVAEGLAAAIISRTAFHDELVSGTEAQNFKEELSKDEKHRRKLLEELLVRVDESNTWGVYCISRFVDLSDSDWFLQRICSGRFQSSASMEAKLLVRVTNPASPHQMSSLWFASQSNEILHSECIELFAPIQLDSDIAGILRDNEQRERQKSKPKLLDPPPVQRIESDLQRIEQGQITDGWLGLTQDLTLEPTSTHYKDDFKLDLTLTPGWRSADTNTRRRILRAARRYAVEVDPQNSTWFSTPNTPYVALAGIQALAFLFNADPEGLGGIAISCWHKWIPALVRYPIYDDEEQERQRTRALKDTLLKTAYLLIPEEVVQRVLQEIDQNNDQHGAFLIAADVAVLMDDFMGKALLNKVSDRLLKAGVAGGILQFLLKHNVSGARELAESLMEDKEQSRAISAIQALVTETPDASWSKVWPIISTNDNFGKQVIEAVSYSGFGESSVLGKLNESQLGEFYKWMVRSYPYATHNSLRSGAVGPSDAAVMLRDSVLEHLKRRGSFAACEALRDVVETFPEYPGLHYQLEEAESLARAATWQPVSARQFLMLALDNGKRFVTNGKQLIETVVESLDRLNLKLHAELNPVEYLWVPSNGGYKPRDEEDLSDYIASHLDDDLRQRSVIVNREVQIRRGPRGSSQSTDVHVDTIVPDVRAENYERLSLIIEVKGNWHDELLTAMRTQLRDRYLKDSRSRNGLYLVGWFTSPRWDEKDYRKAKPCKMSIEDAQNLFQQQATDLSRDIYTIKSYVLNLSLS